MAPKRPSVALSESSGPSNVQRLDLTDAPSGCSFLEKTLVLNNVRIPYIHYKNGDFDEIWMPAKPVVKTTGEANITHVMERVFQDDKKTFDELVTSKGLPLEGCYGFTNPPNPDDYHEKKAIWVNESGFYAMVLGSRKSHCMAFQRWVLHVVLPSIRRTGIYEAHPTMTFPVAVSVVEPSLLVQASFQIPPPPLQEMCLNWVKDFKVSRQDVSGVKSQFKAMVLVEITAGQFPQKSPVDSWVKAPPFRFKDLAQSAVSSYKCLLKQRYDTIAVGEAPKTRKRRHHSVSSEDGSDEEDVLKVSEVMQAAGVWRAVWSSYRSDLANQMLSLKCIETSGGFSSRRSERVSGNIQVLVHKYKKSTDWPLAWRALQNTRDVYEKRIREFLEDMYRVAGHSEETISQTSAELAGAIAAALKVSETH